MEIRSITFRYTQGGSFPINFLRSVAFQNTNFLSTKHDLSALAENPMGSLLLYAANLA